MKSYELKIPYAMSFSGVIKFDFLEDFMLSSSAWRNWKKYFWWQHMRVNPKTVVIWLAAEKVQVPHYLY